MYEFVNSEFIVNSLYSAFRVNSRNIYIYYECTKQSVDSQFAKQVADSKCIDKFKMNSLLTDEKVVVSW